MYFLLFFLILNSPTFIEEPIIQEVNTPDDLRNPIIACLYQDGVIISAVRDKFFSLFYCPIIDPLEFGEPIEINVYHEFGALNVSGLHIVEKSGEVYFVMNCTDGLDSKSVKNAIFRGKLTDHTIVEVEKLPICYATVDYPHFTISADGLRMTLSSDYSGKHQLAFYERENFLSDWNFIEELESTNDGQRAVFPRFQSDSTLIYTAIDERNDMNIYSIRLENDDEWQTPEYEVEFNTENDDLGLMFINDFSGYFTSNRDGSDKLYYFELE